MTLNNESYKCCCMGMGIELGWRFTVTNVHVPFPPMVMQHCFPSIALTWKLKLDFNLMSWWIKMAHGLHFSVCIYSMTQLLFITYISCKLMLNIKMENLRWVYFQIFLTLWSVLKHEHVTACIEHLIQEIGCFQSFYPAHYLRLNILVNHLTALASLWTNKYLKQHKTFAKDAQ